MQIELVPPDPSRENDFMSLVREFRSQNEHEYVDEDVLLQEGFHAYLRWLARGQAGLLEGLVPWSAFWAVHKNSGALIGISSVRHKLSPWLAEFGGHVGYRVRPSNRRCGFGTQVLQLTLAKAAALGIERALVVCTPENVGSQGVLRKCGAAFEREAVGEGIRRLRYWLNTA